MKKIIFLVVFTFLLSTLKGQQEGFKISGTVSDQSSGEPIENASITIKESNKGTITNAMGQFHLKVSKLPFFLEFSHVRYEAKVIGFEHKPFQELQVNLIQKSEKLSEVIITSQRIDTLYTDRYYSILDYELCDSGILLLIYRTRLSKSELLLKDYLGNKLVTLDLLPMKPLTLYKDCLNEIHILSKSHAYQVSINDDQIKLYDPYELEFFTRTMSGCKFKIGEKLYFEDYEFYDLIKKYYYVNTIDTTSHNFATVADRKKINFLEQNPENYILTGQESEPSLGDLTGQQSDFNVLAAIRNISVELRFNKMAYLSRIYAPIYAMNDSISIFNHPENVIEFYNTSDSLIGKTVIDYHHNGKKNQASTLIYAFAKSSKWLQEIYVDEVKNKAYTIYQNINGTKDLKEINLKTGDVSYKLNIPFPYVQKIKIRNNYIYFVYKGYGESRKKKLFRQQIN